MPDFNVTGSVINGELQLSPDCPVTVEAAIRALLDGSNYASVFAQGRKGKIFINVEVLA